MKSPTVYEGRIRESFEELMRSGSYPETYTLTRLAGGEYASVFTNQAWRFYYYGAHGYTNTVKTGFSRFEAYT